MRSTRPQRQVAVQQRLSQLETNDHSDEFNSNSENESDLSNRRRTSSSSRPQRECKSRTKTLVAISLAEQDYDKFDLGNTKKLFVKNREGYLNLQIISGFIRTQINPLFFCGLPFLVKTSAWLF